MLRFKSRDVKASSEQKKPFPPSKDCTGKKRESGQVTSAARGPLFRLACTRPQAEPFVAAIRKWRRQQCPVSGGSHSSCPTVLPEVRPHGQIPCQCRGLCRIAVDGEILRVHCQRNRFSQTALVSPEGQGAPLVLRGGGSRIALSRCCKSLALISEYPSECKPPSSPFNSVGVFYYLLS